jgi:hypothetical protein
VTLLSLAAIFERKNQRYLRRTSSGNWTNDRLTEKERRNYAKAAGHA